MLIRNQQDQIFYQSRLNSYEDGLQRLRQQLELDSFQEVQRGEQLHHHELASRQLLKEQAFHAGKRQDHIRTVEADQREQEQCYFDRDQRLLHSQAESMKALYEQSQDDVLYSCRSSCRRSSSPTGS